MTDRTAPTLPPEVFESVVNALAATLIQDYRERWSPAWCRLWSGIDCASGVTSTHMAEDFRRGESRSM
jgi:hypothetical protein